MRAVTITIRPNPPIADNMMPLEWGYADDVDFVNEDEDVLLQLLPICKEILKEWNLYVNESKTEFTKVYLAGKDDVDAKGEPLRHREEWRKSKSLGSKLCSKTDILHRCNLGNFAFQNYKKIWMQGTKIQLKTKLKIYEAQVTSVMLYNCNSWAATQKELNKLDVTHRNHLRQIIGMQWPKAVISNIALYKRCELTPLSERIGGARWRMLGHILRSDDNTPAQLALHFAVNADATMKGRVGRHQNNLFRMLKSDLVARKIKLKSISDLYYLKNLASDRSGWKSMQHISD
jgi:hypothetical protein